MEVSAGVGNRQVFADAEIQQLKKLAELYIQAKGLILYSEEIDPESRSNLQVIKELRDANDHLMRVIAARFADNLPSGVNDTQSYCFRNLDKAIGHVYRAAFDALDGTILSLREKVAKILDAYPQEVIRDVIPEYWKIRVSLDELTNRIAANRATKDVGADIFSTLEQYVRDTELIKKFYSQLLNAVPSLDECQTRRAKEAEREHNHHFWIHVRAGVLYSVIVGLSVAAGNYALDNFWPKKIVEAQQPPAQNQHEPDAGSRIAPAPSSKNTKEKLKAP
ncbi:MAG: hypothetical protein EPN14_01420 [Gallionella sp.]|nr:MAG: hypothetical protein EPN14_01420 [Gallionella sp.]